MSGSTTPWLERAEWVGGVAASRGMKQLFAHWFGAAVWNGLSVPLLLVMQREGFGQMPMFLRFVLASFVALGVLILVAAVLQTARVARFRALRLELDPFPGSIGGQVGGSLELPVRPGVAMSVRATLHCIHSHMRGSGENRSRREDVVWSAEVIPEVERAAAGIRLHFAFDVPDAELPESDVEGGDYHYWTVHLAAELPGADLDQSFVVPVYRVDPPLEASRRFDPPEPDVRDLGARGISVERAARGLRIEYRRSRFGAAPYGLLAFGSVCLGSGLFIFQSVGGSASGFGLFGVTFGGVFLVVFGLVGCFLLFVALHMLVTHLTVEIADGVIRSTRSYLFFPSVSEARVVDVDRIEAKVTMQSGQGSGAKTSYTVRGTLASGGRILLGDGIRGAYLLDRIRALLEAETGVGVDVALRKKRSAERPREA